MSLFGFLFSDIKQLLIDGPYGWILLAGTILLPWASIRAIRRGSRLAYLSLAIFVGMIVAWVLYYTTGWWTLKPGESRVISYPLLVAWSVLGLAKFLTATRDDYPE